MKTFRQFLEEDGAAGAVGGPANCVGGGAIAGAGVNSTTLSNQAEPGVSRKKGKIINPVLPTVPLTRK